MINLFLFTLSMCEEITSGDLFFEDESSRTVLDSLIEGIAYSNSDTPMREQLLELFDLQYFFSKPFDQQESFIAQSIERCFQYFYSANSIESLSYSLYHLFGDFRKSIDLYITQQFVQIFQDESSSAYLLSFFVENPCISLSLNAHVTNCHSLLIQLFYQTSFLNSASKYIKILISLEFHNYSTHLQKFIGQRLTSLLSLSKHFLNVEMVEAFSDTLLPSLIKHCCVEHHWRNLFSLIVNYPNSIPRLSELKHLLKSTKHPTTFEHFEYELHSRFLHPGSSTSEILTLYLSATQTLYALGCHYHIIDFISNIIFAYLKGRDDTFRCIISSFLAQNSCKQVPGQHDENVNPLLDLYRYDGGEEKYLPSFFTGSSCSEIHPSTEDFVSIFTNIYGSKELFISEYRSLLADRILSNFEFDLTSEFVNLSKLEAKFGESYFTYCQVMLKDIGFSLELQDRLSKSSSYFSPLIGYVLSHNFWPNFLGDSIMVPEALQHIFTEFKTEFESLKLKRTLEWKFHVGLVELEVNLKGKTFCYSVNPLHAIVLLHFKHKTIWILKDMASMLKVASFILYLLNLTECSIQSNRLKYSYAIQIMQ